MSFFRFQQLQKSRRVCSLATRRANATDVTSVIGVSLVLVGFAVAGWLGAFPFFTSVKAQEQRATGPRRVEASAHEAHEQQERLERRAKGFAARITRTETKGKAALPLGPRREAETTATTNAATRNRWQALLELDAQSAGMTETERYDKPREAAQFFRQKRLPAGADEKTPLPLEKYEAAAQWMLQMPHYATTWQRLLTEIEASTTQPLERTAVPGQANTWEPLGPGNIGGRTRALVIHPQQPDIMYSAGVSGGVWKSQNAGQTWTPIGDKLANLTVSSLLLDPANPNTLYVGTGEGVSDFVQDNFGDLRGSGIYKSTDAGATFTRLTGTNTPDFYYVNDLALSPANPQRLYAATRTGVWRTDDGGATWAIALNPRDGSNAPLNGGCLDLAIRTDKKETDVVFASCGTFTQARIYRSTDAAQANAQWTMVLTEALMGRTALALAPSNQDIVYAIASVADPNNRSPYQFALHAVFRSTNGGESGSWTATVRNTSPTKLNRVLLSYPPFALATNCGFFPEDDFSGQGWFDITIAVDPTNPNSVWVGGIDVFRSDDGGVNWGQATHVYLDRSAPQYIHTDQHVLVFHPQYNGTSNQTLYVGNDGGLWRTQNARAAVATGERASCKSSNTSITWTSLNNYYGVTQFYNGAVYPDGKQYFGGTQDNGTLRGSDAQGINGWEEINGGDGGVVAVDRHNPTVLYAENYGFSIQKSTDNGGSFGSTLFGIADPGGLFIVPFVLDPSDGQRLYTGGAYIWRSTNGGSQWQRVSTLTDGQGDVSALAIAPTDANYGLAGMSDGFILRTSTALTANSTTRWIGVQPRTGFVSSITFDPQNRQIAYATYSSFGGKHVWRSTDAGATWSPLDGSGAGTLPDIPVHTLALDPTNPMRLYLGTDVGVFVSNDLGGSWAVENTGFANVITETLVFNVINGEATLFAFTHGRGAWRVRVPGTACSVGIAPRTVNVGTQATTGTIQIKGLPNSCGWTTSSNASWLRVTNGATGTGAGVLTYAVDANPNFTPRTGTLTVAGNSFVITQAATPDTVAPTLRITSHNSAEVISDNTGSITIVGTASDNAGVTGITWTSDRGFSGTATGTSNWTAAGIPLANGRNVITFTARDAAGNLSRVNAVVISRSPSTILTAVGIGTSGATGDGGAAAAARIGRPSGLAFDAQGNLYIADMFNDRIRRVTPDGKITTIAGSGENGDGGDGGPALAAKLNCPTDVAIDAQGNVYFADSENHRIRRVAAADGIITTVAGTGTKGFTGDGGPATAAQLNTPRKLLVDERGTIYLADTLNHRIRRVDTSGVITTIAGTGTAGFAGDGGAATAAQLNQPHGLAFDLQRNLVIADKLNNRIRKINLADGIISTIAGNGNSRGATGDGGTALNARFGEPEGIWYDVMGNLLIAETFNDLIRRVAAEDGRVSTLAGTGTFGYAGDGGSALSARFFDPVDLVTDAAGRIYVADRENHRIRVILTASATDNTPPQVTLTSPAGNSTFTTQTSPLMLSGTASDSGFILQVTWRNDRGGNGIALGTSAWTIPAIPLMIGLNNLTISAYDVSGNVSTVTLAVTYEPAQLLTTLAGDGTAGGSGDGGAAIAAQLWSPRAVAVDAQGNVYIADTQNHRIRKVTPGQQIMAFAGNGIVGSAGDGGAALEANFNAPRGVAVDSAGNVYIADTLNNRIRKVTASDGKITTIVGTGRAGTEGDGGLATAAQLDFPVGLALDAQGNLYIADMNNHRIRKLTASDGKISTVAGNGETGFSGDGGAATAASLLYPSGVAVDRAGNLFISDQGNQRIRRVAASDGKISTIAGTGEAGYDGDNKPAVNAAISEVRGLAVDSAGDLYLADQGNHRIRKITLSTGIITTVAGTGTAGFAGDNGAPQTAALLFPTGVAIDTNGNLYVADGGNHRVRKIQPGNTTRTLASVSAATFQPNVASEAIVAAFGTNLATSTQSATSLPLPTTLGNVTVRVRDSLGVERLAPLFFVSPSQVNYLVPAGTANGAATVTIASANGSLAIGTLNVNTVAPGLFTVNSDGQGLVTAVVLRVRANGQQVYEAITRFDAASNRHVAVPIELGPEGDQVYLVVYGTGLRGHSGLAKVTARIGNETAQVVYAGGIEGLAGLDQVNILLPRTLAGKGEVTLMLTVDERPANTVRLTVR